jgi:hypothetical protein
MTATATPRPAEAADLAACWAGLRAALLDARKPSRPHLDALGLGALYDADAVPNGRIPAVLVAQAAETAARLLTAADLLPGPDAARGARESAECDWFRASDATLVRRSKDGALLGVEAGRSEMFANQGPWADADPFPSAVLLVGADPPALLERLWTEGAPRDNGYAPRVLVVEPDPSAAVAALTALVLHLGDDAAPLTRSDRLRWFVGPGAPAALERWLRTRIDERLPRSLLTTPGRNRSVLAGELAGTLERLHADQRARTPSAAAPRPTPARVRRVQIVTSRYTTYVRFAAADLASSLSELGLVAEVLQERDASSLPDAGYFRAEIERFRPDLVININHLRGQMGGAVPEGVPFVTWAQDAMPHLVAPGPDWRAGPLDFIAGFTYPALCGDRGFDRARTLARPNAVSGDKFHAGPADADRHAHLRCEMAMATRHSEPPRTYLARCAAAFGVNTPGWRAAGLIGAGLMPLLDASADQGRYLTADLRRLTEESMRRAFGAAPEPGPLGVMLNSFTLPLADLAFRQQIASWAAAIAQRRGWRLHLYGRGWSDHPTLAAHARPELTHGEELRAACQLAEVHLHGTVRGPMHQRLAEIAMSGGLSLVRRTFEDADRSRGLLLNQMHGRATPDVYMVKGRHPGYEIANHAGALSLAAEWGRLGMRLGTDGLIGNSPAEIAMIESTPPDALPTPADDPNRLLVDLSETTFAGESELENRVSALVGSRVRRNALSAAVAARCRERFGLDRFARDLLAMVHRALGAEQ